MDDQWDAFRSQKRASVAARHGPPLLAWMIKSLQVVKLLLFLATHSLLIGGTLFSRLAAVLLAGNVLPASHQHHANYERQCHLEVPRSPRVRTAALLALFMIQAAPDVLAMARSFFRVLSHSRRPGRVRFTVVAVELFRSCGVLLLFLCVLPSLDIKHALFTLCAVQLVPMFQDLVGYLSRTQNPEIALGRRLRLLLASAPHFILCLLLLSATYLWSILDTSFSHFIVLPIAIFLLSVGFWEAWITPAHAGSYFHHLYQIKYGVRKVNDATRLVLSSTRLIAGMAILEHALLSTPDSTWHDVGKVITTFSMRHHHSRVLLLGLGVAVLNGVLRSATRFLGAMRLRVPAGLHPLTLVQPVAILAVHAWCHLFSLCSIGKDLAGIGLAVRCTVRADIIPDDTYICFIWLVISVYRAYQSAVRPEFEQCDEVLESMPAVCNGLCIEQSLVIFEHSLYKNETRIDEGDEDHEDASDPLCIRSDEGDRVSTLYVCATMWHETRTEMTQMFKSILKLDEEREIRDMKRRRDGLQFKLEVHIFFDDAWEDLCESGRTPNQYFQTFFDLICELTEASNSKEQGEAGRYVPPSKMLVSTSYGGRLVVRLPMGTLLFVHLKDKKLIRHKKRWSQVMYMYYLLGHRIMDSHMSLEDRQLAADNTYILAIDGDSKFEPEAVMRLLHLMHTKSDIGCACGRIHPIGSGIMVMYQKFEYSIAHWFQKAAEHVFGCVLCAPGCFSLFRASTLMDDNIMHKYTKMAEEPRHFVQYDQGEDRWLSTLMLKQGYRIEYAAASDAETYAPEGFEEFFNQRRRWTPSSVANTVDLLADYKRVIANNESMSRLYIFYQFCVIGFSMLGPGIIFSMLVFAQVTAFAVDSSRMMLYNATPIILYIAICFLADSAMQLAYAKILSIIYSLVMIAVLVATTSQVIMESVLAPTSLFIVAMILIFAFAAVIHPQECSNILHGTIFFLMIPATYVILSLYSLINLNVINWGTREAVAKATGQAKAVSPGAKWLQRLGDSSLGRALQSRLQQPRADPNLEEMTKKIERMERSLRQIRRSEAETDSLGLRLLGSLDDSFMHGGERREAETKVEIEENGGSEETERDRQSKETADSVRASNRLQWMDAEYLQVCTRGRLKASEERFWDQLIDTYLKPIETTPAQNAEAAAGLASLRNSIAFSIIILNCILVLAIFLIQRNKEILCFDWNLLGGLRQLKRNPLTGKFERTDEPLEVDPLGMAIILILVGILLVQTAGMLLHRLNTLLGALQELDGLREQSALAAPQKMEDDDALLAAARAMVDTSRYGTAHGADGFTRATPDTKNVLYKLQRARLAERLEKGSAGVTDSTTK